jgi:hypothetical protein
MGGCGFPMRPSWLCRAGARRGEKAVAKSSPTSSTPLDGSPSSDQSSTEESLSAAAERIFMHQAERVRKPLSTHRTICSHCPATKWIQLNVCCFSPSCMQMLRGTGATEEQKTSVAWALRRQHDVSTSFADRLISPAALARKAGKQRAQRRWWRTGNATLGITLHWEGLLNRVARRGGGHRGRRSEPALTDLDLHMVHFGSGGPFPKPIQV